MWLPAPAPTGRPAGSARRASSLFARLCGAQIRRRQGPDLWSQTPDSRCPNARLSLEASASPAAAWLIRNRPGELPINQPSKYLLSAAHTLSPEWTRRGCLRKAPSFTQNSKSWWTPDLKSIQRFSMRDPDKNVSACPQRANVAAGRSNKPGAAIAHSARLT